VGTRRVGGITFRISSRDKNQLVKCFDRHEFMLPVLKGRLHACEIERIYNKRVLTSRLKMTGAKTGGSCLGEQATQLVVLFTLASRSRGKFRRAPPSR
jgi:hypothetical protein